MKGFFPVALLCALANPCHAAGQPAMHGTIQFTGAVVGSSCTLTRYTQGGMHEHCPGDAVPETLSAQSVDNGQRAQVRAMPGPQGMAKGESQYELVSATGSVITQGLYVITQSLR